MDAAACSAGALGALPPNMSTSQSFSPSDAKCVGLARAGPSAAPVRTVLLKLLFSQGHVTIYFYRSHRGGFLAYDVAHYRGEFLAYDVAPTGRVWLTRAALLVGVGRVVRRLVWSPHVGPGHAPCTRCPTAPWFWWCHASKQLCRCKAPVPW